MSERIPCSEYDAEKVRCLSGFPVLHSVCHGAQSGCPTCGVPGIAPMCMREDLPAHLIRPDGMPIGWPNK
uniref:hypothetical protein n=1 Tax=Pseudomonas extremaustralis TaxID=359110 RepID=UPI002AA0D804|nr:hypothetical protein [Pseudomonas extremaustralis]MDY7067816.1 hypothetical protein [Pseudomonas extremaustralis]